MKTGIIFVILIGFLAITSGKCQELGINAYQKNYVVGEIQGLEGFMTLNEDELRMDSLFSAYGIGAERTSFKQNRGRIFMDSYRNGKIQAKDEAFIMGLPTPCDCSTRGDTTIVKIALGFFGGFGFTIKIYEDKFESSYFEYTDDVKPYKVNLEDTAFYSHVSVENKYQSLILDVQPSHKVGQQITGYFTFTSNDYYEKLYRDSLDSLYVSGKIYFSCKVK
jgi:hypothetical protein